MKQNKTVVIALLIAASLSFIGSTGYFQPSTYTVYAKTTKKKSPQKKTPKSKKQTPKLNWKNITMIKADKTYTFSVSDVSPDDTIQWSIESGADLVTHVSTSDNSYTFSVKPIKEGNGVITCKVGKTTLKADFTVKFESYYDFFMNYVKLNYNDALPCGAIQVELPKTKLNKNRSYYPIIGINAGGNIVGISLVLMCKDRNCDYTSGTIWLDAYNPDSIDTTKDFWYVDRSPYNSPEWEYSLDLSKFDNKLYVDSTTPLDFEPVQQLTKSTDKGIAPSDWTVEAAKADATVGLYEYLRTVNIFLEDTFGFGLRDMGFDNIRL